MKLCKDCIHSTSSERCHHPKNMKIDYYSGKQEVGKSGFSLCTSLRSEAVASGVFWCGPAAKFFEPRPAQSDPQQVSGRRKWWEFWKR